METPVQAGGLQTLMSEGLRLFETPERPFTIPLVFHATGEDDTPSDDRSVLVIIDDEGKLEWDRAHWCATGEHSAWILDGSGGTPAGKVLLWADVLLTTLQPMGDTGR